MKRNVYGMNFTPSIGNPKVLVIPVWFTDSGNFIDEDFKEEVRCDIEAAYFGSEEDTGWHSVKSFYEYESHGKLTYDGTVSEWYEDSSSYTEYGPEESGQSKTQQLVKDATSWYFKNHKDDKRTNYDTDKDGCLDGVMLIYGAPDYSTLGWSGYSMKNLWAYCSWLLDTSICHLFAPGPNVFFWASYDFMYGDGDAREHTGLADNAGGDTRYCNIDAHTYIHEMGHVFGLNDYYDYNGNNSPAAGFSMQDLDVGGHDAFSSFALGWGQAYIPTESMTLYVKPFVTSGEMVILSPSWNESNSAFDEYLILEYYTTEELNELDSTHSYCNARTTGASKPGIRLWHVDARLGEWEYDYDIGDWTYAVTEETDPLQCKNITLAYDNSTGGEDYNLLHMIRNSKSMSYNTSSQLENKYLFKENESFSLSEYKSQFFNKTTFNNGKSFGYSFSVDSLTDEYAKITITKA